MKVEITPERVERGKLISNMLCNECHLDPKRPGNPMPDLTGRIVNTANLTPDPERGIGDVTKAGGGFPGRLLIADLDPESIRFPAHDQDALLSGRDPG